MFYSNIACGCIFYFVLFSIFYFPFFLFLSSHTCAFSLHANQLCLNNNYHMSVNYFFPCNNCYSIQFFFLSFKHAIILLTDIFHKSSDCCQHMPDKNLQKNSLLSMLFKFILNLRNFIPF